MEISTVEQVIPFIVGAGAFFITYMVIPVIINVSHLKHLCDEPGDQRKLHIRSTPNLGGVAIFAALFITFALSSYATKPWIPYLAAGLTILFFSGLKDDILVISPLKKLLLQMAAVGVLLWGHGPIITDLGGVFGFHQISLWSGIVLTFFTMIVVVNAYNLIDGIDGLAGGIGVIATAFFSWWFWQADMMSHAVLALTMVGSLLAFLRYNFQPASIFMGDTGSQIVGYVLAFLAVSFVDAGLSSAGTIPFSNTVPVMVLSILIVPLYDTLRVFMIRAFSGNSPFQPDRLHVHHQLLDLGFSHRTACYIIYSFNLSLIGLTMLLSGMEINLLFGSVLLTAMVLFPTLRIKRNLLKKIGINIPTAREIRILEWKIGTAPGRRPLIEKASHAEKEGKEYKEVAV